MTEDLLEPSLFWGEHLEPALGDAEPSLADIASQGTDSRCKKCILSGTDDHCDGETRNSDVTPASLAAIDLSSTLDNGVGCSNGVDSNSGNGNSCFVEDRNNISIQVSGSTLTSDQHEAMNLENNNNNNIQEGTPSDTSEMPEHVLKLVSQRVSDHPLSPTITSTDTAKFFDKTLVKELMDSCGGSNGSNSVFAGPDISSDADDLDSDAYVSKYAYHISSYKTTTSEPEPYNIQGPDTAPNSDISEPESSPNSGACMYEYANHISSYKTATSKPDNILKPDISLNSDISEPENSPDSDTCMSECAYHISGYETPTSEPEPDHIPGPDISPNSDVSKLESSLDSDACMSEYANHFSNYDTPTSEPEPDSSSERESNPSGSSVPVAESSNIPTGTMVTCRVELDLLYKQILKDRSLSRPVQQCTDHEPGIYSQMDIVATPNQFPWQPYKNIWMRKPQEESSVLVIGAHASDTTSLTQPTQPRPPEPKFHEPVSVGMQDQVPLVPSHDYQVDMASHRSYKDMPPSVKLFMASYGNKE